MVFDGARLNAKENTERERENKRKISLEEGKRLHSEGKSKEATTAFCKAIDVTPEMARNVILAFRRYNVQIIVAPFEADAQLAYLSHRNLVDFIISEDSDCLPYGCQRVLFKLDRNGCGQMLDLKRLRLVNEIYLEHFTNDMFLDMCILSGCDYLDSIKGVGIKTAYQLVAKYKTTERILRGLRFEVKDSLPKDYDKNFIKARLTFKHQVIYNVLERKFTSLTTPIVCETFPSILKDLDFLGKISIPPNLEFDWANGDINPVTFEKFIDLPALNSPNNDCTVEEREQGLQTPWSLSLHNDPKQQKSHQQTSIEFFFKSSNPWKSTKQGNNHEQQRHSHSQLRTRNDNGMSSVLKHQDAKNATTPRSKFFRSTPGSLKRPPPISSSFTIDIQAKKLHRNHAENQILDSPVKCFDFSSRTDPEAKFTLYDEGDDVDSKNDTHQKEPCIDTPVEDCPNRNLFTQFAFRI